MKYFQTTVQAAKDNQKVVKASGANIEGTVLTETFKDGRIEKPSAFRLLDQGPLFQPAQEQFIPKILKSFQDLESRRK